MKKKNFTNAYVYILYLKINFWILYKIFFYINAKKILKPFFFVNFQAL